MGEVYSARDARLHRSVAIKVLPAEFSRVPDRVARFSQEAKAAAALNHPGVVSIFDVGLEGDVTYVVSELLEGETLRALLSRGKLSRKRAGDLAAQMASGHGRRASEGHHPSRSEARERLHHARGAREDSRLRPRAAARARRVAAGVDRGYDGRHVARHGARHRRLYGARAGARRTGRSSQRHLRVRRGVLRDARRSSRVLRRLRGGADARGAAARSGGDHAWRHPRSVRADRPPLSRKAAVAALSVGGRCRVRDRSGFQRQWDDFGSGAGLARRRRRARRTRRNRSRAAERRPPRRPTRRPA